jgi:hypothetical protein
VIYSSNNIVISPKCMKRIGFSKRMHISIENIDLCKQNYTKAVDERLLGQQRDFQTNHVIKLVPYILK